MKLEFESNTATLPLVDFTDFDKVISDSDSPEIARLLRDGIEAAQKGERAEARTFLMSVTEVDADNENAWLWLASISEYPEELLVFLKNVLDINPANERANEWAKATESLMSKTFVQRGIEAAKSEQTQIARQCFLQAIVYDERSELAWLWLASVSVSPEEKMSHLQKVLSINPANEDAAASLKNTKTQMAKSLLSKANEEAINGDHVRALQLLGEIVNDAPDLEDAWMLKAHLSESLEEKIKNFERVVEINPDNQVAKANLGSLKMFVGNAFKQSEEIEESKSLDAAETRQNAESEHFAGENYEPENSTEENSFEEDIKQTSVSAEVEMEESAIEAENEDFGGNDETETVESEVVENFASENSFADYETENSADDYFVELTDDEVTADEPEASDENYISTNVDFDEVSEENFNREVETDNYEYSDQSENFADDEDAEFTDLNDEESAFENREMNEENQFEEDEEFFVHETFQPDSEPQAEVAEVVAAEEEAEISQHKAEENGFADSVNSVENAQAEMMDCGFCGEEIEQKAFACGSCRTVLTLSDIEMILSQEDADRDSIVKAIVRMDTAKNDRGVVIEELKLMGIGYINLKEYRKGFEYLKEASYKDTHDVMFGSQVDALALRISEIEEQEQGHANEPKCKTILVVDDSPTVRKLIAGKLEKCGHEAVCAVDGMDALAKVNEALPDLILLDITMPRMDGYQVCKLLRGNDATKDIPVVMISGKDGFFDKVRGKMAGTSHYITKPFGPETLMKTVNEYIK